MTDLLFAVDSCTAKVAQIPNQYISFSSSVVAMFGLRAMFFVVEDAGCAACLFVTLRSLITAAF